MKTFPTALKSRCGGAKKAFLQPLPTHAAASSNKDKAPVVKEIPA
jgi:hypothetical protein